MIKSLALANKAPVGLAQQAVTIIPAATHARAAVNASHMTAAQAALGSRVVNEITTVGVRNSRGLTGLVKSNPKTVAAGLAAAAAGSYAVSTELEEVAKEGGELGAVADSALKGLDLIHAGNSPIIEEDPGAHIIPGSEYSPVNSDQLVDGQSMQTVARNYAQVTHAKRLITKLARALGSVELVDVMMDVTRMDPDLYALGRGAYDHD